MTTTARLSDLHVERIKEGVHDFMSNSSWARAFLYKTTRDQNLLGDEDRRMMLLISMRFFSFKEKFAANQLTDEEYLFGTFLMLMGNHIERAAAERDAQQFVQNCKSKSHE